MTEAQEAFTTLGRAIPAAEESRMFGKACFKLNGKAFVAFFQDEMVFKLSGDYHRKALALHGAKLFDPSGKGRAMKEWVQVPFIHQAQWNTLAKAASAYVGEGH
jgi:hypothetical protein